MRKAVWWTAPAFVALVSSSESSGSPRGIPVSMVPAAPIESRIRDLDIEFYQHRVLRDPRSARDYTQLAGLYLQRARETAANADLVRAEENARRSLSLRTGRNGAAYGVLASSLLSQHRFREARDIAARLVSEDSTSIAARGLLGETQYELGEYEAAGHTLGSLAMYRDNLSVAPRLARWEELHGRPEEARRLLREAQANAESGHGMPKEQLAWFHLRLGDLALRNGHLGEAEDELRAGLRVQPNDYRILGTLSRLEASRQRWRNAIDYGEQAIASTLDPATLGIVGDAYRALGDTVKADEYYHTMEVAVLAQPGPFHRAWSLFLLDHNRDVPKVLAKVEEEVRTRRDIYGYDLLAWALHKSGRNLEARSVMSHALGLGTRDAALLFHAGMIERALGANQPAVAHLRSALEVNPHWDPFQPEQARAVLDSLGS
jgi:tetratricopeptide (TPR) repeat protein